MTVAQLNGFLPSDFAPAGRLRFTMGQAPPAGFVMPAFPPVEIHDARALQADAESEAAFLAGHGFVLLPHATRVRDWDQDVADPYLGEIEAIVRERLLPGRRIEVRQQANLLRRGRGTAIPFYANGVHSDFGRSADDYEVSVEAFGGAAAAQAWRAQFERPEVAGFMMLDFWRVTNMREPLRHMPLALCDPRSVDPADLVDTAITGIAPSGLPTHHLSLRFNPGQLWYYYPGMTGDELLAFKLFECWKDDRGVASCFHTAFEHPDTPADAEPRQSCEHRVGVVILKD